MKFAHFFYLLSLFLVSCSAHDKKNAPQKQIVTDSSDQKQENTNFFPVTNYIKGQIFGIKHGGVNPLKLVTSNGHTDSTWLKMDDLDKECSDFLLPEIDTANLTALFSEKKFLDQTIGAFTLTYDPVKPLPDSFYLKHWDVYIDPNSNQVSRIYLLKELAGKKTQQLTWMPGKGCNMVTIGDGGNGSSSIEKQVAIKWDY